MGEIADQNTRRGGWFRFRYEEDRDSPNETRNLLLIVATLIAAVTFQAGVNPPGGVWQDDEGGHKAGRAIYSSQKQPFYAFLIFNTIALSTSIQVIMSLTYRFPFFVEIWIATASMFATYASALFAIAPDEEIKFRYVLLAAAVPFIYQMFKKFCSNHDTGDKQPVNVERVDGQRRLSLSKPIKISIGNNEARGATIRVLGNSL